MARIVALIALVSLLPLTGCYQVGYVAGTGVKAVRHPVDTATRVYRY
ncbi:MAG TPA: hypothetical protein VEF76_00675 [Patescibacteria group bacterium]|nr:hypothetical protein [Patescibacteria group bacterium]